MIFAAMYAPSAPGRVRPLDPGRDMRAVADLIEIAFRGELDRAGNSLVADMRHLAALGPLLTIADRVAPCPSGYVYEQGSRVLGNVTVNPEDLRTGRWFISNVAVHPSLQGRGIGRQLMDAALEGIRRQRGRRVLLQVRTDNEPAQRLYRRLGFERFDTVVEMLRPGGLPAMERASLQLRRLQARDWAALLDLARATTPPAAQEVRPLVERAFRPTLAGRLREWLDAFVSGRETSRWGLEDEGVLQAVVSLLAASDGTPARLDLAVRPSARGRLEGPLADAGLAGLRASRPRSVAATVSASHQEAVQALTERHFLTVRVLDQLAVVVAGGGGPVS